MPWSPRPGHGFTQPSVEPWLPFGEDAEERNIEAQLAHPDSALNFVRSLLQLRRTRPSLNRGSLRLLDDLPDGVLGFDRTHHDESTTVLINFSTEPRVTPVASPGGMLMSTEAGRDDLEGATVTLNPHEAIVIEPSLGG